MDVSSKYQQSLLQLRAYSEQIDHLKDQADQSEAQLRNNKQTIETLTSSTQEKGKLQSALN